jgi:hypothetical protein
MLMLSAIDAARAGSTMCAGCLRVLCATSCGSYAYVGTYANGAVGGIPVLHVDPATGAWTPSTVTKVSNQGLALGAVTPAQLLNIAPDTCGGREEERVAYHEFRRR